MEAADSIKAANQLTLREMVLDFPRGSTEP